MSGAELDRVILITGAGSGIGAAEHVIHRTLANFGALDQLVANAGGTRNGKHSAHSTWTA